MSKQIGKVENIEGGEAAKYDIISVMQVTGAF